MAKVETFIEVTAKMNLAEARRLLQILATVNFGDVTDELYNQLATELEKVQDIH